MVKYLVLLLTLGFTTAIHAQLITANKNTAAIIQFDSTTNVYLNFGLVSSFRTLKPNEAFLNTPLGLRENEIPLTLTSFEVGISMPILKGLKINAGLSLVQNGEAYSWTSNINDSSFAYTSVYRYIALPISLSTSYGKKLKLRLSAGLTPAVFNSYKKEELWTEADGSNYDDETAIQDDLNSFVFSAQGSAGLEYFFRLFSIRASYIYRQQLSNTYKENQDYIHKSNASGGQLTFTYFL